jgi:hypothetical protein
LHLLAAAFRGWRFNRGILEGVALITNVVLLFSLRGWGSLLCVFMLATTATTAHVLSPFPQVLGISMLPRDPRLLGWGGPRKSRITFIL